MTTVQYSSALTWPLSLMPGTTSRWMRLSTMCLSFRYSNKLSSSKGSTALKLWHVRHLLSAPIATCISDSLDRKKHITQIHQFQKKNAYLAFPPSHLLPKKETVGGKKGGRLASARHKWVLTPVHPGCECSIALLRRLNKKKLSLFIIMVIPIAIPTTLITSKKGLSRCQTCQPLAHGHCSV